MRFSDVSMTRRRANLIELEVRNDPGSSRYGIYAASNLMDAYGGVAGVGGKNPALVAEVAFQNGFASSTLTNMARYQSSLSSTPTDPKSKVLLDMDQHSRPSTSSDAKVPSDDETTFLRCRRFYDSGGWGSYGTILVVPPYDFYTTKSPIFTLTGKCPNLNVGSSLANLPDSLSGDVLNFRVGGWLQTVSMVNLDDTHPIYFSFHPGVSPSVLKPGQELSLTGGALPELYVASPTGNPWFTFRGCLANAG